MSQLPEEHCIENASASDLRVEWLGRIAFDNTQRLQDGLLPKIRSGESPEQFFLLEHDPVFTIGRTPDESSLLNCSALPYPLHRINRGGKATYHGPGQLVGYPMLDLQRRGQDLHRYLRFLEDFLIALVGHYGIDASRREGLTGVWIGNRKIASIGVGVRHWVTMHGFALNVHGELDGFRHIVPCGISGVEMTSIQRESGGGINPTVQECGRVAADAFPRMLASRCGF